MSARDRHHLHGVKSSHEGNTIKPCDREFPPTLAGNSEGPLDERQATAAVTCTGGGSMSRSAHDLVREP